VLVEFVSSDAITTSSPSKVPALYALSTLSITLKLEAAFAQKDSTWTPMELVKNSLLDLSHARADSISMKNRVAFLAREIVRLADQRESA